MKFKSVHKQTGILLLIVGQLFLLSACGNNSNTLFQTQSRQEIRYGEYEVQKGDSLYSIAWRYKRDYKELAQINGIQPPYIIKVGQKIKLTTNQDEIPSKSGYTGITIAEQSQQTSQQRSVKPSYKKPRMPWSKRPSQQTTTNLSSIKWQWPAAVLKP